MKYFSVDLKMIIKFIRTFPHQIDLGVHKIFILSLEKSVLNNLHVSPFTLTPQELYGNFHYADVKNDGKLCGCYANHDHFGNNI
jgi:hypothetical protein